MNLKILEYNIECSTQSSPYSMLHWDKQDEAKALSLLPEGVSFVCFSDSASLIYKSCKPACGST